MESIENEVCNNNKDKLEKRPENRNKSMVKPSILHYNFSKGEATNCMYEFWTLTKKYNNKFFQKRNKHVLIESIKKTKKSMDVKLNSQT